MALDLNTLGREIGPITREYNWKDLVLYALGVGAGFSELEYCYEKDLKVVPSFAVASIINFDFLSTIAEITNVNILGVLHGEQKVVFHETIPVEGTLTTRGAVKEIFDKKDKGAVIIAEFDTFHSNGNKLHTNILSVFSRFDGNFGGADSPEKEKFEFPDRSPDYTVSHISSENQPQKI